MIHYRGAPSIQSAVVVSHASGVAASERLSVILVTATSRAGVGSSVKILSAAEKGPAWLAWSMRSVCVHESEASCQAQSDAQRCPPCFSTAASHVTKRLPYLFSSSITGPSALQSAAVHMTRKNAGTNTVTTPTQTVAQVRAQHKLTDRAVDYAECCIQSGMTSSSVLQVTSATDSSLTHCVHWM